MVSPIAIHRVLLIPILPLAFCLGTLRALPANCAEEVNGSKSADSMSKQGLELRRAGRDSEALPKFQEAYRISATPRNAAQLGLCLQALARWSEADGLLAEAISAVQDPWIKKNRATLKEASETAKAHVGRLEIIGSPDGAVVSVNGRSVGSLPLADAVKVNEGSVDIEVSAEGCPTATRNMMVAGASYQRVVIRLKAQQVPEAKAPVPASDIGLAQQDNAGAANKEIYAKPWFWGAVAGGLLAVGATVFLLSRSTDYPTADQRGSWQQ